MRYFHLGLAASLDHARALGEFHPGPIDLDIHHLHVFRFAHSGSRWVRNWQQVGHRPAPNEPGRARGATIANREFPSKVNL